MTKLSPIDRGVPAEDVLVRIEARCRTPAAPSAFCCRATRQGATLTHFEVAIRNG